MSNDTFLAAAEKTFREIFNYSSDLIYIQDINGVFIDVNQAVLDHYGYKKDELIGKTGEFLEKPGKNDLEKINAMVKLAWEKEVPKKFEWQGLKKDGTEFIKEVVIRKGLYFGKKVIIATARDITERIEAEDQLRKSNNELKKVNAALDAFVYSASHDLKAPLSSLKGLLELMKHDDPEKAGEYISRMELSIEKLNKFIYDLVDYSRNSKMDVQIKEIKINEKVRHLVNALQYAEEGESVIFDLQLNTPPVIFSDNFRLEVILRNLISNSIRYHDKKKNKQYIIVRTALKDNMLILEVIDNGIGIEPEHQEKVFDMFYRANELNKNGSGLGLFMVKEAVELLNGTISFESKVGVGTKMKVEIPLNNT